MQAIEIANLRGTDKVIFYLHVYTRSDAELVIHSECRQLRKTGRYMALYWLSKRLISVRKSLGGLAPAEEASPRQAAVGTISDNRTDDSLQKSHRRKPLLEALPIGKGLRLQAGQRKNNI